MPIFGRGDGQQPAGFGATTAAGSLRSRYDNSGGSRLYELHGLLVRELMIRRLKKEVMSQLPPKRRQVWGAGMGGCGCPSMRWDKR